MHLSILGINVLGVGLMILEHYRLTMSMEAEPRNYVA